VPLTSEYNLSFILSILDSIKNLVEVYFIIRPHPEVDISVLSQKLNSLNAEIGLNVELDKSNDSIEEFSNKIDISVSGNSSAAKDIFDQGIPIAYHCGLDVNKCDAHGWVERGFFFEFSESHEFNLNEFVSFYLNLEYHV
jgi:hypothetical protein